MRILRLVTVLATCSFIIATASATSALAQSVVERPDGPLQTGLSLGFTGNSLVSEAGRYIGSNRTGRKSLWCGAFMDLVLKRTGHQGGGNLAANYARYGKRVPGPVVGAIAVMGRKGGGHVGVVSAIEANGNPVVISGNTWSRATGGKRAVSEHVSPRRRVYAYVMP